MKSILLFIVAMAAFFVCSAQVQFTLSVGDSANPSGITKAIQTSDGGYLISGIRTVSPKKAFLIKVDSNGDTLWTTGLYDFGNLQIKYIVELQATQEYIAYGYLGNGIDFLCKVDLNGNLIWIKSYSWPGMTFGGPLGMIKTTGDSLLLCEVVQDDSLRLLFIKVDASGNFSWAKKTKGQQYIGAVNLFLQAQHGEILISTCTNGNNNNIPLLIKMDSTCNIIWSKAYEYEGPDEYGSIDNVDTSSDGNYIISFDALNLNSHWQRITYCKIDTAGNIIWSRWLEWESAITNIYSLAGNRYLLLDGSKVTLLDSLGYMISGSMDTTTMASLETVTKTLNGQLLIYSYWSSNYVMSSVSLADSIGNKFCNQIAGGIQIDSSYTIPSHLVSIFTDTCSMIANVPLIWSERGFPVKMECSTVLKASGEELENEVLLFPNPSQGSFSIKSNPVIINERLEIYNVMGEKIYSTILTGRQQTISENFPCGIYLLKINVGEKQVIKKLLIN